ncbi:MAG: SDR family oxidoreductase [Verrucomicrobiota bacterium]|nr:SDR family oxidoreductase [Verrucomicrobiota bacterium]
MNVLVVGANGKVGTLLCGKLWAVHDFSAVALIRDSRQQTKFTALGVPSVNADLEEGIAEFLPGMDAVVFSAGSGPKTGPEKTTDVDQNAAIRLIEDCETHGVRRFVMVSAIGADPNSESNRIRHYLRAKGVADARLRASKLDYTILAPGTLIDEPGNGRIQIQENLGFHGYLPREDLVSVILETLRNYLTIGKTLEFVSGAEKIKPAIASVVGGGDLPPIA